MKKKQAIMAALVSFRLLKYYPADEAAQMAVADLLDRMTASVEQVQWLMRRVEQETEWGGPGWLRALLCDRYTPADGVLSEEAAAKHAQVREASELSRKIDLWHVEHQREASKAQLEATDATAVKGALVRHDPDLARTWDTAVKRSTMPPITRRQLERLESDPAYQETVRKLEAMGL